MSCSGASECTVAEVNELDKASQIQVPIISDVLTVVG